MIRRGPRARRCGSWIVETEKKSQITGKACGVHAPPSKKRRLSVVLIAFGCAADLSSVQRLRAATNRSPHGRRCRRAVMSGLESVAAATSMAARTDNDQAVPPAQPIGRPRSATMPDLGSAASGARARSGSISTEACGSTGRAKPVTTLFDMATVPPPDPSEGYGPLLDSFERQTALVSAPPPLAPPPRASGRRSATWYDPRTPAVRKAKTRKTSPTTHQRATSTLSGA